MALDDLSRFSDEELYALEQQRALDHASWSQIDDELRRRRASRGASLADMGPAAGASPSQPTLGDLERVAASLEATFQTRLADLESRVRRLRGWVIAAPLIWFVVFGAAAWVALRQWVPGATLGLLGH